jgi:hypothetical protein
LTEGKQVDHRLIDLTVVFMWNNTMTYFREMLNKGLPTSTEIDKHVSLGRLISPSVGGDELDSTVDKTEMVLP